MKNNNEGGRDQQILHVKMTTVKLVKGTENVNQDIDRWTDNYNLFFFIFMQKSMNYVRLYEITNLQIGTKDNCSDKQHLIN